MICKHTLAYMQDADYSFGQNIRRLREAAGISLRELARATKVSAPFLSDVELGRRFPNDETLSSIAKRLRVGLTDLKEYDTRSAVSDLKKMADQTPSLGAAFRAMVDKVKSGEMTAGDLANQLKKRYGPNP